MAVSGTSPSIFIARADAPARTRHLELQSSRGSGKRRAGIFLLTSLTLSAGPLSESNHHFMFDSYEGVNRHSKCIYELVFHNVK